MTFSIPPHRRLAASIAAIVAGSGLLTFSVLLLQLHFQALKDVREYALPLAADVAPLERRVTLLKQQTELSALEASFRTDSAEEKLHVYVLPQSDDLSRLLAFLESARTFLENHGLLKTMSSIAVSDPVAATLPTVTDNDPTTGTLQARTIQFTAVLKPEGRSQLLSILELSGMLTVGDVLSPNDMKTLFSLTENQNYAAIVPVEQFLSADLLAYVQDPRLYDERLSQALSSEDFLTAFRGLLDGSALPQVKELLTGDLGRTLIAQKLWPVQFMTIDKESLAQLPDGDESVDLTVKVYSRK